MKQTLSLQTVFIYALILFWGVPFLQDFLPKQDAQEIVWTCIWLVNTIYVGISSFLYTKQHVKWNWYLPLGLMLCFLPLPFLFYEWQMMIFVPIYGIISFLAMGIAMLGKKKQTN